MKKRLSLALGAALLALGALAVPAYGAQAYGAQAVADGYSLHVPIVMIHRVDCPHQGWPNSGLFLCPDQLDHQMAWLASHGWMTITADELAGYVEREGCPPARTFVITLDDGALDGYTNGAPIFDKYGFHASYAMVTGKAGDYLRDGWPRAGENVNKPHFSWDQARDLLARGHDLINHTVAHTSVKNDSNALMESEVGQAQADIEHELGYTSKVFVYPYGSFGTAEVPYLAAHFTLALTDPGSTGAVNGADETTDPLHAPRIRVVGGYHPTGKKALLRKLNKYATPC